ncbi:MAG TPA: hypothetical protein VF503_05485 [Sphingobium sp.]
MNHPRNWFGRKRIGIGWSPRTWEGWIVVASLVAAVLVLKHLGVIGAH